MKNENLGGLASELMKKLLSEKLIGDGVSKEDLDSVISLCMLCFSGGGTEDPKAVVRRISYPFLEHLVKNVAKISENPSLREISKFIVFEWYWRNDLLLEDWRWSWTGKKEGQLEFKPKVPLETIALPT